MIAVEVVRFVDIHDIRIEHLREPSACDCAIGHGICCSGISDMLCFITANEKRSDENSSGG